jgi:hypothetical protein
MQADWNRVERSLGEAKEKLEQATAEEQFQGVGLLCREILISLAQVVYDPSLHPPDDGPQPSKTDAKGMLGAYLKYELQGATHEGARKFIRAAFDLTNELQHRRTASFRDAALCIEATNAVVRAIDLVSGHLELSLREAPYKKIQSLMPKLIAEMSTDLKQNPVMREFVLWNKGLYRSGNNDPCFFYYFEDHDNLISQVHVLENYGFVTVVTTIREKRYRITERFAEYLLSLA